MSKTSKVTYQQNIFICLAIAFVVFNLIINNIFAASKGLPEFTDIIAENSPAVVNISTMRNKKDFSTLFRLPPGLEGTPHGDMFRKFFEDQIKPHSSEPLSLGSGVIVSSDGYIVTNNHVISEADKILVKLSDKREYPAKLVGTDAGTDLALLKINAKDLPFAKLGNSDSLKVGEWVVAIGSPFGFEYTSTAGIVSGKGRHIGRERYVPFIQTDVAINPGNSGGPLFNLDGEVVGINAQILSKTGGYLGLSFAIPANVVKNIITQLKELGYVNRGWLGIGFQEVDRDIAKSFGLDRAYGALVANVVVDSPADKAGVKTGDIILKFNNEEVLDATQLPAMVGSLKPDEKVDIELFRGSKKMSLALIIGRLQPDKVKKVAGYNLDTDVAKESKEYNKLGFLARDLNADERKEYNVAKGGAVISSLESDGIAENIGLAEGDVILSLNMKDIKDSNHLNTIVNTLPYNKWIPILVKNDSGSKRYFPFKITK